MEEKIAGTVEKIVKKVRIVENKVEQCSLS